jgi:hypothetical protein
LTTAVDSTVLLDLLSEPVYSECSPAFPAQEYLEQFLTGAGVLRVASSPEALFEAGLAWKVYLGKRPRPLTCPRCGSANDVKCAGCGSAIRTRQHLIADFLIGAHASVHADRTRDRGFYRRYFGSLSIVEY